MRVLIADPDRDVRDMIADLLGERGAEVCGVGSADEALTRLDEKTFDVVLCHLPLLREGGDRMRRHARALSAPPRLVAMSAIGARAASDEADANLAKPFTRAQLLDALGARSTRQQPGLARLRLAARRPTPESAS